MLKKIIKALIALFFICVGLLVVSVGYIKNNPDTVFEVFRHGINKVFTSKPYEEHAEENLQGLRVLHLQNLTSNLKIELKDSPTLKILYHGHIAGFEQGPLISAHRDKDELEVVFHEPMHNHQFMMVINGQNVVQDQDVEDFEAQVIIPDTFQGVIDIESKQGPVQLTVPAQHVYEFDLKSVSGVIENKAVQLAPNGIQESQIGHVHISTESGNISVTN